MQHSWGVAFLPHIESVTFMQHQEAAQLEGESEKRGMKTKLEIYV